MLHELFQTQCLTNDIYGILPADLIKLSRFKSLQNRVMHPGSFETLEYIKTTTCCWTETIPRFDGPLVPSLENWGRTDHQIMPLQYYWSLINILYIHIYSFHLIYLHYNSFEIIRNNCRLYISCRSNKVCTYLTRQ